MIYSIFFSIFLSLTAQADWSPECEDQAARYGKQNFIDLNCIQAFEKTAHIRKTEGDWTFYGQGKVFVLKNKSIRYVTAGEKPGLSEIISVALDIKSNRILILDQSKSGKRVLLFRARRSGNVVPKKIIESPALMDVSSVSFDEENSFIGSTYEELRHFNLNQDSRVIGEVSPFKIQIIDAN